MILFFYILKDYFKYVIGTVVISTFLFILFDFIHKSTSYLAKYNPDSKHLVLLYLYRIPDLLIQGMPIASLLASVICMVLLSRTNEVTAMRAAGMSPLRIALPITVGGLILSGISFFIGEFVLPETAKKLHYVAEVLIEKETDYESEWADGIRWIKDGNNLYMFRDYDPVNKVMKEFVGYLELDKYKTFRPSQSIFAKEVFYRKETDDWLLKDIRVISHWPNGTISGSETRAESVYKMPVEPEKLQKDRRYPNEKSLFELQSAIEQGRKSGEDVVKLEVDMQVKFALHFASFIVSFIGLKFGYRSERSTETARSVLMAIAVGVSYWFILNAGRALALNGSIPPIIGAWSSNFILLGLVWLLVWQTKKSL
jgi:lipopolysaccharide export system permease protein